MNTFIKRYTVVPLILRIVIGMVIGIALALAAPGISWISTLGSLFTTALKAIAPILVFFLVIGALCTARSAGNMKTVICLYIVSTLVAGALAVVASYLFPSELVLTGVDAADATGAPQELSSVIVALLTNALSNPVDALASANYLGVLVWAVFIGIALRKAKSTTKDLLQDAAKAVTTVVRGVIECAPFGILGLIYSSVSTSGVEIFTVYGHLVAVLVAVILVVALVTNPLIVFLACRVNPYPLVLRCLKESAVMAFFTRSSAANIPVNMKLCQDLGLDEDNYSVSIPLGATINMAGASITIAIMTMAACNTLGIVVDPVLHGCYRRLRHLGRCRRFAHAHPACLLALQHRPRHLCAGRGRGLHHRRDPGLLRDGTQLQLRRGVHRCGRAEGTPSQGPFLRAAHPRGGSHPRHPPRRRGRRTLG